jgi:hypothetical protein
MAQISCCFIRSHIVTNFLLVFLPIFLVYSIYLIPDVEGINASSTIQISTYDNPNLGIRIEHPTSWKPFERTSAATNAHIIEFVPIVQSEHDPLTPFFSISIENLNDINISKRVKDDSVLDVNASDSELNALTDRNIELAESLSNFNIIESNGTFSLSDIPAYKLVYTFADPGSPLHPVFESMNIWA